MKKITFTAKESLIKQAQIKAKHEMTTLNSKFKEWLIQYVGEEEEKQNQFENYWKKYEGLNFCGASKLNRAERNER